MKLQPSDSSIAAQVLSATIAHELGHLLLPPRVNHSRTGIMAAWWTVTELTERYRTHVAELTFTPQETELIRQKLRPEC
jgi:hypothetical protein